MIDRRTLRALTLTLAWTLAAGLAHGRESLFPDLRVEDFPEAEDTVRFAETEASPGLLTTHSFHLRADQIGFASVLTAVQSLDPETRRSRLDVQRLDDDCLTAAEQAEWEPEAMCATVSVIDLAEGIARFVLRNRFVDYQVQLTLAQDVADPAVWRLIPTGRRGEPRELTLRVGDAPSGDLGVTWRLADTDGERSIELRLGAELPRREIEVAGFSPLEAAALSALDLFDDVADFYVRDWVVRSTGEIVDEGIWSPSENDPGRCELTDVCGAEYQTCTPTPAGGFWACNVDSGIGGWGGGFLPSPPGGGGGVPPALDPDWTVGRAPSHLFPQFYGLQPAAEIGYYLDFSLTSVLEGADTTAKYTGVPYVPWETAHVVELILYRRRDGPDPERPAEPLCRTFVYVGYVGPQLIPAGDTVLHQGDPYFFLWEDPCDLPREPGVYVLRFVLDPWDDWYEGVGERNNVGDVHGLYLVR